jgi:hypothetical protein
MKTRNKNKLNQSGFTAAEMAVSTGILVILGLVFIQVLHSGMILYAKNTAVNSAHTEARDGISRLTRDIHASISVPQLRDTSFNVVSSTPVQSNGSAPMAAGVSFQNVASGPNFVWKDPGAANLIMIRDGANKPTEGMHIVIPFWNVEDDIVKVTASGTTNHSNVFLANGQESMVASNAPLFGGTSYAITYYTERVMYLVKNGTYVADSQGPYILSSGSYIPYTSGTMQRYRYENGELHYYKQGYAGGSLVWQDKAIVARYISNPTPFYIPLVASSTGPWYESTSSYQCYTTSSSNSTGDRFIGTPDSRYVGVKLSARDPKSSNRGFLATATLLDTQIDYRSRIALYQ